MGFPTSPAIGDTLAGLLDVNLTGPVAGDSLTFDVATSKWINDKPFRTPWGGLVNNNWYTPALMWSGGSGGPFDDTIAYAFPYWTQAPGASFDHWGIFETVLDVAGSLEVGVYSALASGYPDARLLTDSLDIIGGGPLPPGGAFRSTAMGAPFAPALGDIYWIAIKTVSTTAVLRLYRYNFGMTMPLGWVGQDWANAYIPGTGSAFAPPTFYVATGLGAGASLPATFPAGALAGAAGIFPQPSNAPMVAFQSSVNVSP